MVSLTALRAEVAERLAAFGGGGERLRHIEAVVRTTATIARAGGWPPAIRKAALREGWIHDALKMDGEAAWRSRIESAGEIPDPWAAAHAPDLLHAQAAAVWAAEREEEPSVVSAVRHHPTARHDWDPIGRILYVADFCEPTRAIAPEIGTAAILQRAGQGEAGLAGAAQRVLTIRLGHLLAEGRPTHPESWRAWNAWAGAPPPPSGAP